MLASTCLLLAASNLAAVPAQTLESATATKRVVVDVRYNRRPIHEGVYGASFASPEAIRDLRLSWHRMGGNSTTRYNWRLNADNRAADWYFQSIADGSSVEGERGDTFFQQSRAGGAEAALTVPMIGWVAKLAANRQKLWSYSVAKYGAQTATDYWNPDSGNGYRSSDGQPISGNDANDANVAVNSTFMKEWVQHLVGRWGQANAGGVPFYVLDNEPSIWHSTHRDVFPVGLTMDELRNRIVDYGTKIKQVDPSAKLMAPEEWGWSGYWLSGYDQQWGGQNGWWNLPDRAAHGGADYLPWLLDQLKAEHNRTGQRLVDVFTVHFYPQGGEYSNDVSQSMQARRNRSTRGLWDPDYVDETWIGEPVRLVPRLHEWVASHYPGTQIGLTEYSWGADGHMNGATAQADILGILGREGLHYAARWVCPEQGTPTYAAMRLYRNADGKGGGFGDLSVRTKVTNPDELSAFGAQRTKSGELTVIVVDKVPSSRSVVRVVPPGFVASGPAKAWCLGSDGVVRTKAVPMGLDGDFWLDQPGPSVTLLVIPPRKPNVWRKPSPPGQTPGDWRAAAKRK